MLCEFSDDMTCKRCGYKARRLPTYRHCQTIDEMAVHLAKVTSPPWVPIPDPRLGDRVAQALEFFGITKERARKLMKVEDCGCDKRQQGLNRFSEVAAKAVETVIDKLGDAVLGDREVPGYVDYVRAQLIASQDTNEGLKSHAPPLPVPPPPAAQ